MSFQATRSETASGRDEAAAGRGSGKASLGSGLVFSFQRELVARESAA